MKVLVILAAVICVTSAATLTLKDNHKKTIVNAIQKEIVRRTRKPGPDGILPPIDDLFTINDTMINFDELKTKYANGWLAIAKAVVTGLSTFKNELVFNLFGSTLTGKLVVGKAAIETDVKAAAQIHFPFSGGEGEITAAAGSHFSGSVELFSLKEIYAKLHANLTTDRGTISDLDAHVFFDGVVFVNGAGISWNGVPVEWKTLNNDLPAFIEDLIDKHRETLLKVAENIVNVILADISIKDLIDPTRSTLTPDF